MTKKQLKNVLFIGLFTILLYACEGPGMNTTGREYMPDMAHSLAVEANTHNYYSLNTWDEESVLPLDVTSRAKRSVPGTIARGYAGQVTDAPNAVYIPMNGSAPYHYEDSEEGRAEATAEITKNPFPITEAGLAKGKELYDLFCAICHGSQGKNGDGIYASGAYPLAPANMVEDSTVAFSSPGRYYHAIMYGKNAMGAYKGKMSYEERWQVIHYIRSLQAKQYEADYTADANTLNDYGLTLAQWEGQAVPSTSVPIPSREMATDSTINTINAVDQPQIPGEPRRPNTTRTKK
jgi:mono/diheme cytochrome c family protein